MYIFQEEFEDLEIHIQICFRVAKFSDLIILAFFLNDNSYKGKRLKKYLCVFLIGHLLSLV